MILTLLFSVFSCSVSEDDMWTCPNCGKSGLTKNFCPSCGTAKPEDEGIPFEYEIGDIVAFASQEYSDDTNDKLVWIVAALDGEMVTLVCISKLPETVVSLMNSDTSEGAADYAKYMLSKKLLSGDEAAVIDEKGIFELSDCALYPELPVKKSGKLLVMTIDARKIAPYLVCTEYTENEPADDVPAGLIEGIDYSFDDDRPVLLKVEETRKEQYIREYARLIDEFIAEYCVDGDWAELTSGDNTSFSSEIVRLTADSTEDEIRTAIDDALEKEQFPIECELYQAENLLTLSVDCRIRKGAGLSYETLDILPAGEQVYRVASVDSSDGTWYEIRYKGGKAYLSSSSFENKKPAAASHVTTPTQRPTQTVITPKPTSPAVVTPTPAPSATATAHTHKYKYIYKDSIYHNRTCSICGYIKEKQKHDKECKIISGNSEQHLVVCSECGQELYYENHRFLLFSQFCSGCNYKIPKNN